jgi:hypothetical protein
MAGHKLYQLFRDRVPGRFLNRVPGRNPIVRQSWRIGNIIDQRMLNFLGAHQHVELTEER